MTDLMDDRLRSAAERWQQVQPPPPPVPEDLSTHATSARRSRAWIAAAAAVAAVAVPVVVTTTLSNGGGSPTGDPAPATTPTPTPVIVHWADLPATHPKGAEKYEGAVMVSGDLDARAVAGSTFDYVIYLTALGSDVTLDPCPDYSVWVGAAGGPRRSLNCAGVPYVDDAGRPYLPAGVAVAFDMRLDVPDLPGRQKILWVINGPHRLPGTHGVLTIH